VLDEALLANQRLELECDLIAAHILATGGTPPAQFLGERGRGTSAVGPCHETQHEEMASRRTEDQAAGGRRE
jgi:hypothetical protein